MHRISSIENASPIAARDIRYNNNNNSSRKKNAQTQWEASAASEMADVRN